VTPGEFPNFEFVRSLKKSLGEGGTVFRFAYHENTVLNQIYKQLEMSSESDRLDLMKWIRTLTSPSSKEKEPWTPTRKFVDMCEFTKRFYYLPDTGGSNSIKKVLPAVLNVMKPESLAKFEEWVVRDPVSRRVLDPYKLLPPIFSDVDLGELEKISLKFSEDEHLADGGAAMMAWARMQFTEMSSVERDALRDALLKYCKLDTLAMVMIWEWWGEVCGAGTKEAVRSSKK
jgi:hypothetical protein